MNLLAGMPPVYARIVPELGTAVLPAEKKVTCQSCVMAPKPGRDPNRPFAFTAKARCCTYNPLLTNHVVGRILSRDDRGSEKMRERIASGIVVNAFCVSPTLEWNTEYRTRAGDLFGRDDKFTCPFWVDEPHACTIWQDRNGVCRSWFCKHEGVAAGRQAWNSSRDAIEAIDAAIAIYCITNGEPPRASTARTGDWIAWFRWCAARVDLFDEVDIQAVRTPKVLAAVQQLIGHAGPAHATSTPVPDVVVPSLLEWITTDQESWATAYSVYDMEVLPKDLFAFLSQLDGTRPWREALAGSPGMTEAIVQQMWDRSLLSTPDGRFRAGGSAVIFTEGPWGAVPELQQDILDAFRDPPPGATRS